MDTQLCMYGWTNTSNRQKCRPRVLVASAKAGSLGSNCTQPEQTVWWELAHAILFGTLLREFWWKRWCSRSYSNSVFTGSLSQELNFCIFNFYSTRKSRTKCSPSTLVSFSEKSFQRVWNIVVFRYIYISHRDSWRSLCAGILVEITRTSCRDVERSLPSKMSLSIDHLSNDILKNSLWDPRRVPFEILRVPRFLQRSLDKDTFCRYPCIILYAECPCTYIYIFIYLYLERERGLVRGPFSEMIEKLLVQGGFHFLTCIPYSAMFGVYSALPPFSIGKIPVGSLNWLNHWIQSSMASQWQVDFDGTRVLHHPPEPL